MKTDGQSQFPHYAYILRISGKEYVKEKLNMKAVYKLHPNCTTPCNRAMKIYAGIEVEISSFQNQMMCVVSLMIRKLHPSAKSPGRHWTGVVQAP
jgi:hypothetical protein